jgi:hypothetical protein
MASAIGFVRAGLTLGLSSLSTKPKRGFSDIQPYITLEETHQDEIDITDHPIEQGASISDHALKRPAEVTIKIAWSNSTPAPGVGGLVNSLLLGATSLIKTPKIIQSALLGKGVNQVPAIYQRLLAIQEERKPIDVFTGKRVYKNMMLKTLTTQTDKTSENILSVTITFRQVILVATTLVAVQAPAIAQAAPKTTLGAISAGAKSLLANPAAVIKEAVVKAIKPEFRPTAGGR